MDASNTANVYHTNSLVLVVLYFVALYGIVFVTSRNSALVSEWLHCILIKYENDMIL